MTPVLFKTIALNKKGYTTEPKRISGLKKGFVHGTELKQGFENCNEFEIFKKVSQTVDNHFKGVTGLFGTKT